MSTSTASATTELTTTSRSWPAIAQRLADAWRDPVSRPTLVGALVCTVLLGFVFRDNLAHFVYVWWTDQNYSHGFLVPLISLYFANEVAQRQAPAYRPAVGLGCVMLATAIMGRLATVVVPVGFVGDLSFLVGLAGIVALLGGRDVLRRYAFALAFLVFMLPLPIHLYTAIANPLQLMVSRVAAELLNATGIPVLCEGNHLTLPGGVRMFVAEACSGMRQLTGFLALTTAVAFLSDRPVWYRMTLVASAIPIALTANITRVLLTGWIMYQDPRYAQGTFHTVEGLLMMGMGLALLNLECRVLNTIQALWIDPAAEVEVETAPRSLSAKLKGHA